MAQTLAQVKDLENLFLLDDQPNIEGFNLSIGFVGSTDYNFADRSAFETKYQDQLTTMATINNVLERGEYFISLLYCYRGCSRALPQVKTQDQENKAELYQNTFEVLEPEIKKLKDFRSFQANAIDLAVNVIKNLTENRKSEIATELLISKMLNLLDLLVRLDALKNMKACLNNDFAFYRRAFGFLRKNLADETVEQENQEMYLFLANQNIITSSLKQKLHKSPSGTGVPGFDDVLMEWLSQAATMVENEQYMVPKEKHTLLRVIPLLFYLMDSDDINDQKMNAFKKKNFKMDRYTKIYRHFPVIPLYGDMHIESAAFIRRCKHYTPDVWVMDAKEEQVELGYKLTEKMKDIRETHDDYIAKFATMVNEVKAIIASGKQVPTKQAKSIYSFLRGGFTLLSRWTSYILEQAAWKFSHPATTFPLDTPPDQILDYEKAVRYNYSSEERFALIETIAMIKGLSGIMSKADGLLAGVIRRCVHDEMQEFIQATLREMIRGIAKKSKKSALKDQLMTLRFMCAHWLDGVEPNDPAMLGKKDAKGFEVRIPSRSAGPSPTQLVLMRAVIHGLYTDRDPANAKGGLFSSKDFSAAQIKDLEMFYNRSYYYSYLLDYAGTLNAATDLSMLWYREFFLELQLSTRKTEEEDVQDFPQFPIEMSLPWVLTDHILENHAQMPHMMEYIFYSLDLYNDAAQRALRHLQQRFMFEEIEAEVNLCFDQLVYKLCDIVFNNAKLQASCNQIDSSYKKELAAMVNISKFTVPKSRFLVILQQRHFQLLGRSVDVAALVAQRMNHYLRTNIDYAISRFEASDLTSVLELEAMLENVRQVHAILEKYLPGLDSYETMLGEVNDSSSVVSFHSRIVLHIVYEVVNDVTANLSFNTKSSRFIRPPLAFTEDVVRDNAPKIPPNYLFGSKALNTAMHNVFELQKGFFGLEHMAAVARLLGPSVSVLISQLLEILKIRIENHISPYVTSLLDGMPESSKLPMFTYGSEGVYGFYEMKLQPILGYSELKTEVFQVFRELGNAFIFVDLLERAMDVEAAGRMVHSAPFTGSRPGTEVAEPDRALLCGVMRAFQASQAATRSSTIMGELANMAQRAGRIYVDPPQKLSIGRAFYLAVNDMLHPLRNEWMGPPPVTGVLPIEESFEFYRLWSALQFVFCIGPFDQEFSNKDFFGDGFLVGGAALVYFMKQRDRFEVFDFNYHCLNVEAAAAEPTKKAELATFLRNAAFARTLNSQWFNILHSYLPMAPSDPDETPLEPPEDDVETPAKMIQ